MTGRNWLTATLLVGVTSCGDEVPSGDVIQTTLTGTASVGAPLDAATVTVYRARSDLSRGDILGTTETSPDGQFTLSFPEAAGLGLVCASGGAFVDVATNSFVQLGSVELCAVIEELSSTDDVGVSIWTELVRTLASARVSVEGRDATQALNSALLDWRAFLSCNAPTRNPVEALPKNPSQAENAGPLDDQLLSGILHAGLSSQAVIISEQNGFTPGVRFTLLQLLEGLTRDIEADASIDGNGASGPVTVENYTFTGATLRSAPEGLPQGIRDFVEGDRNAVGVAISDVTDLLACMAENTSALFGEGGGGILDIDPPVITFLAPNDGQVVNGLTAISAIVVDASPLASVAFADDTNLSDVNVAIAATTANISATFDPAALDDGEVLLELIATDEIGNEARQRLTLIVDKDAPMITIVSPGVSATVSGTITIEATVVDAQGIVRAEVISPENAVVTISPDNTSLTARWDTLAANDGPTSVVVEAEDAQGNVASSAVPVTIDNFDPGEVAGVAALETPVNNATVTVYAFEDFIVGGVIGSGSTDSDGLYDVELLDTYSGPILVEVTGTTANYRSAVSGQPVSFSVDDRLRVITTYAPTPGGTVISDLQVNALTTLAAALAETLQSGDDAADIDLAYELFGEHLNVNSPIDIRRTRPSNLREDSTADSELRQRVALFHAGLARWGAETATTEGIALSALPTITVMERYIADLGDTVLNGEDAAGATVFASSIQDVQFRTNSLRFDTATAIVRWLNAIDLSPTVPGRNDTGLIATSFTQPNGFLWGMSGNTSQLFDGAPPIPFDQEGPSITSVTITPPFNDPPAVRQTFTVAVAATDPSGVSSLSATFPTDIMSVAVGPDQFPDIDTQFVVDIDTTKLEDGPIDLVITAVDTVGAMNTQTIELIVDNTLPDLSVTSPTLVSGPSYSVTGSTSDATSGLRDIEVFQDSTLLASGTPSGGGYSIPVTLTCDAIANLSVRATDLAGNIRSRAVSVACDNTPPTIAELPASYLPAAELDVVATAGSTSYNSTTATLTDTNGVWGPSFTIDKYYNRFDYIPEEGATVVGNNLPEIAFSTSDSATGAAVFSVPSAIAVRYRYSTRLADGAWTTRRDWNGIPFADGNQYRLPISLQTLATELILDSTSDHRVEIEATDEAGNRQVYEFLFQLALRSPPIVLHSCNVDEAFVNAYQLADASISLLYTATGEVEYGTGSLAWNTDVPPGTLTPPLNGDIGVTTIGRSEISKSGVSYDDDHTGNNLCLSGCTLTVRDDIGGEAEQAPDVSNQPPPGTYSVWTLGDAISTNVGIAEFQRQDHEVRHAFRTASADLGKNGNGTTTIDAGISYTLKLRFFAPRFAGPQDSGPYDWANNTVCRSASVFDSCPRAFREQLGPTSFTAPVPYTQPILEMAHRIETSFDVTNTGIENPVVIADDACALFDNRTEISSTPYP